MLALRVCDARNGVSRLHGAVTRQQWGGLWPQLPTEEVPISHVTNGVHLQSWITPEIDRLFDRQLGEEWRKVPGEPESWASMLDADDAELWHARCASRARLVEATRARRLSLIGRRRSDAVAIDEAKQLLDPDAFTIGFVGRFVAYKRPTLFLRHPDRLARLLSDPDRPVQIVFAGKAHPNDEHGKRLLSMVTDFAQQRGFTRRLVFIEDFDLTADRALSQGVDLWLNTPRRPLEACGIGGMKAGVNGALNLSTLDGWWDEAWNDAMPGAPPIGWCIGTADTFEDHALQDELDAESLYDQLEHDIVPRFYDRDEHGIPRRWLASVRQSMATLGRDLALAPDGRAVRGRPLPPERAPRGSAPDQQGDARATARRHARPRRQGVAEGAHRGRDVHRGRRRDDRGPARLARRAQLEGRHGRPVGAAAGRAPVPGGGPLPRRPGRPGLDGRVPCRRPSRGGSTGVGRASFPSSRTRRVGSSPG